MRDITEEEEKTVKGMHIDYVYDTVADFLASVSSGLHFSQHQIIQMISASDDNDQPFFLTMNEEFHMLTREAIKEFFKEYDKPKRRMSKDEENKVLKSQLKAMEKELLKFKGQEVKPKKSYFDLTKGAASPTPPKPTEEDFTAEPLPLGEEELPEPQTEEQIRDELAKELREKKKTSFREHKGI